MALLSPAMPASPAGPTKPAAKPPTAADDDLPGDLPALDGDGEDGDASTDHERLDDDEMPTEDGNDPFDDATGEADAAPELMGLDDEKSSVLDSLEAGDLDIGAADLVGEEGDHLLDEGGGDDRGRDEDFGLRDDESVAALDGGEEGPTAEDEGLSDAALPPLGADAEAQEDEGFDDAGAFFDGELRHLHAARALSDAWSSVWERFGSPLSVPPSRFLARSGSGVLSVGRELVRLDLEGDVARLAAKGLRGGDATRVLVSGDDLFVTTDEGGLFVSGDAGATFAELSAWREQVTPEEAAAGLDVVASTGGVLWGRTAQGALLKSSDRGVRWEKGDVDGFVRAVGTDREGGAVLLVRALGAHEVLRRTADGWSRLVVPSELLERGFAGHASVDACGGTVAIAVEKDGVFRSVDGGSWSHLAGTEAVTAMAILDGAGTLAVALHGRAPGGSSESEPQTTLVRVGADGEPKVVAVLGDRGERGDSSSVAVDEEPGVLAMAVDDEHQVVWVAGGFGVAAFQPKMRSTR